MSWGRPRRSLFIATTPRSGSWLLAEGLRELAVAGRPEEYFRHDLEGHYRRQWGLAESAPYSAFLSRVRLEGTTPNGIFAVKVHWFQLQHLLRQLRSLQPACPMSDAQLLERYFGPVQILYLDRLDLARQAISWLRAMRTNEWWLVAPEQPPRQPSAGEYDFESVKHLFFLLQDYKRSWRQWFDDNDVHPLELTYEDLVADYRGSLLRILRQLRLGPPAQIPAPALRRQADQRSELWERAYWQSWRSVFGPAPTNGQPDFTATGSRVLP